MSLTRSKNGSRHEAQFHRSGRILLLLFFGGTPTVCLVGYLLAKFFESGTPLIVGGVSLMFAIIVVSLLRLIAYYRWTGKYPYYWLRRK
jgi:hypothetical protein